MIEKYGFRHSESTNYWFKLIFKKCKLDWLSIVVNDANPATQFIY